MNLVNESGWVIEAAGPKYWTGSSFGANAFSDDLNEAVRFCRCQDASAVLYRCFRDDLVRLLVVREHGWIVPAVTGNATEGA